MTELQAILFRWYKYSLQDVEVILLPFTLLSDIYHFFEESAIFVTW